MLTEQLTSSQITDILAYQHVIDQGPDYFNAPAEMDAPQIKSFIAGIKKRKAK